MNDIAKSCPVPGCAELAEKEAETQLLAAFLVRLIEANIRLVEAAMALKGAHNG